jgi:hypothetical protein
LEHSLRQQWQLFRNMLPVKAYPDHDINAMVWNSPMAHKLRELRGQL